MAALAHQRLRSGFDSTSPGGSMVGDGAQESIGIQDEGPVRLAHHLTNMGITVPL